MQSNSSNKLKELLEEKHVRVFKEKRELKELKVQLNEEIERVNKAKENGGQLVGKSVQWIDIEHDIYHTELIIEGITKEIIKLERKLSEHRSNGKSRTVATE